MVDVWNGTVTMIECLVISSRTLHLLLVLRDGFFQVYMVEASATLSLSCSYYVLSDDVMSIPP